MTEGFFEVQIQPQLRTAIALVTEYVEGVEEWGHVKHQGPEEYVYDVLQYGYATHKDPGVPWSTGVSPVLVSVVVQRLN